MDQRILFFVCALVAILVLCCACFLALGLILANTVDMSEGVSVFNLLIDMVVGFFTIWGLYWAASEFADLAVKPVLRLQPSGDKMPGSVQSSQQELMPHTRTRLYLTNKKSRAGRYIQVVIRVFTTPAPTRTIFANKPLNINEEGKRHPEIGHLVVTAQFPEKTVVYQSSIYAGELIIHWDSKLSIDELPKTGVLDCDVYTLDGVTHQKIRLPVEWVIRRGDSPLKGWEE